MPQIWRNGTFPHKLKMGACAIQVIYECTRNLYHRSGQLQAGSPEPGITQEKDTVMTMLVMLVRTYAFSLR